MLTASVLIAALWLAARDHARAVSSPVPAPAVGLGPARWLPALWLALSLLGCGPVRRATLAAPANTPPVESCTPGAHSCRENAPVFCHEFEGETRWWPSLPRHPSGAPRRCATTCALNDAGEAYCTPVEGNAP